MPNSISEEPINRFPSNLGGSAHQSQLFYMPNSSSEEPSHQHPSNLGGRAHQPDQLSQPERESESEPEIWTGEQRNYYRSLHNAAIRGDWERAKSFIEMDPNALAARIAVDSKTVFHVAALCGQWEFILKLLELVPSPESIAVQDQYGKTVLHYVAEGGSLKTVKALVQKNAFLPQICDQGSFPPLLYSIWSGSNKELVWYLSLMTSVDLSPEILRTLILSGYHDIALYFVRRYPKLALAKDFYGDSLLYWLATNPSYFFSGSNLGLIERWIYKFVDHGVEINYPSTHLVILNMEDSTEGFPELQPRSLANQGFKRLLWKAIVQLGKQPATMLCIQYMGKLGRSCVVFVGL